MMLFQVFAVLPFWSWDSQEPYTVWEQFRRVAHIKYGMKDGEYLYSGWDMLMLVFTWLPPPIAMVATLTPTLLLSKRVRAAGWDLGPQEALRCAFRVVHRAASCPMYPQRFWLWWCNGFSVFDAFVIALFLAAHIVGIQQLTEFYQRPYLGWDAIGLAYPQPKRVWNLEYISLACSWVLYIDFTLIFFPVAHLSFLHTLLGSSWAAVVKYHRWLGHFGLWTLTGHALFYYWYWLTNTDLNFWEEFLDWNTKSSINYLAGSIAWVAGVVMWVTSLTWFRRRFFTIFYNTHIVCAIIWVAFSLIHYYWGYLYLIPGLIALGVDVVFRVFQAQHVSVVSSVHLTPSGGLALLEIPLDPSLAKNIKAGQDVFLQFPDVNRWNWHPFTIYKVNLPSTPDVLPSMTVAIKKYGRWTKVLLNKLQQGYACMPVRVLGPVGGLHPIHHNTSRVVLFVGGVGASPALATVYRLMDWDQPPTTTVVYAARDPEELTILDERVLAEATRTDKAWLSLKLFCTGMAHRSAIKAELAGDISVDDVSSVKLAAADKDKVARPRSSGDNSSGGTPPAAETLQPLSSFTRLGAGGATGMMHAPEHVTLVPRPRWLSSFGWQVVQPVQPRLVNNWHLLLAVCVAWLGGFLGAVQAQSGLVEKWYPAWTNHDSWVVGLMFLGCCMVQAVGLPAILVVYPVHLFRYLRANKTTMPVAVPSSPYVARMGAEKLGSQELAAHQHIASGRPDIPTLLAEAVAGASGEEVLVIVAGPTAMVHQVQLAAWEVNWHRKPGAPFLRVVVETYEM